MNTEELMKMADAYADAETSYTMSRGEWDPQLRYLSELQLVRDEARASLAAALSAKQERISELEAQNAQLLEALKVIVDNFGLTPSDKVIGLGEARAAIAAVESLK